MRRLKVHAEHVVILAFVALLAGSWAISQDKAETCVDIWQADHTLTVDCVGSVRSFDPEGVYEMLGW